MIMKNKKFIYVLIVVLLVCACCGIGYYYWQLIKPIIYIGIGDASSGGGSDIKVKAPYITIGAREGFEPDELIYTRIETIINKHEELCKYVVDNYKTADIQLKMEVDNGATTCIYYGKATLKNGEIADFYKEITFNFTLDAEISYQI